MTAGSDHQCQATVPDNWDTAGTRNKVEAGFNADLCLHTTKDPSGFCGQHRALRPSPPYTVLQADNLHNLICDRNHTDGCGYHYKQLDEDYSSEKLDYIEAVSMNPADVEVYTMLLGQVAEYAQKWETHKHNAFSKRYETERAARQVIEDRVTLNKFDIEVARQKDAEAAAIRARDPENYWSNGVEKVHGRESNIG